MSSYERTVLVMSLAVFTLAGCRSVTTPNTMIRAQVTELTPAPATTTVVREQGQIVVLGGVRATCAPYRLDVGATVLDGTLVITLTGAVAGTACPQDVLWTRGFRATVSGAPAGIRAVRVVHTTDLSGAPPEVIHEGPVGP